MRWLPRRPAFVWRAFVTPPVAGAAGGFSAYARALTLQSTQAGLLVFAASALLWWPLDFVVFDAESARMVGLSRPISAALGIASFYLMWTVRKHPRWSYVVPTLAVAIIMARLGGQRASGGSLDQPHFWFSVAAPFTSLMITAPLGIRAVAAIVISAAFPTAYFLIEPEHWQHPSAKPAVSFLVFMVLVAVVLGHVLYRLVHSNYRQRVSLEERVAARTEALRKMATHLDQSREAERLRLAQDLHDDTSQLLTSMRIEVGVIRKLAREGPETLAASVERVDELIETSFAAYRRMIGTLRPVILDDLGLGPAVQWLCKEASKRGQTGVEAVVEGSFEDVDPEIAIVVFRATQETLTNATRHARASRVEVALRCSGERITLSVHDDGRGFDPKSVGSDHFGLLILRERARAVGGTVDVDASPGAGTRIELDLPATASTRDEKRS